MGYQKSAHYTKHCEIFNLTYLEASVEIALVQFDELKDSFIEIETNTNIESHTNALFEKLYDLMENIGVSKSQLTKDFYIEMIKAAQRE